MVKILLVFHSKKMLHSLTERLRFEQFTTFEAEDEGSAREICRTAHIDTAIVGDDISTQELNLPFIVVTQQPNIDSAVDAMRHGAIDYLSAPIDMNQLLGTLRRIDNGAKDDTPQSAQSVVRHTPRRTNCATQPIIGESDAIEHVRKMIRRVAPSDARVLILGEKSRCACCGSYEQRYTSRDRGRSLP